VAATGFLVNDLSGAGFAKSFGGGPVCFYLWHLAHSFYLTFKNRWREQIQIPAHATQRIIRLNLGATPFTGRT
jgi:hypothetical protein